MNRDAANVTVIYKDHENHPPTSPRSRPRHQPRRGPLDLGIVERDDVSPVSALKGVSAEVRASPATIGDVLTALDAAVAIRADADVPLKVRLARLESDNTELKTELATAKATITWLKTLTTALRSTLPRKDEFKIRFAAEAKALIAGEGKALIAGEVKSHFDAMAARAAARRAAQKAKT
jgi:hypothetical protein